jgi:hypothetical protein
MGIGGAVAVVLGVLLITLIGRDSSSWYQGEWVVDAEKTMTMEHSQATDEQLQEFAQKFLEAMETAMEFKITGDEIMRGAAGMGDKYKIREKYKVLIKGEDWITIEIEKPFRIEGSQENARTTAKIYRDGDGIRIEESATIGEGTSVLYLKRK